MRNLPSAAPEPGRSLPRARPWLPAVCALLVLTGACAGPQAREQGSVSNNRKAAESNTSLGLEYMNLGQFEVALGKLKKAVSADPGYAPGHTVLAVLYERIGERKLAGKHYQKAYEADPENGDVNNNYGVFLCQSGNGSQALGHFRKALGDPFYNSPWVALTNAGSCALGAGAVDDAEGFLRQALQLQPDFPETLINLARLNFERGDYLKSRAFLQRYEAAATHNAESLLLAFRIETASHDGKAANRYRQALESDFPESAQAAEVRRIVGK